MFWILITNQIYELQSHFVCCLVNSVDSVFRCIEVLKFDSSLYLYFSFAACAFSVISKKSLPA